MKFIVIKYCEEEEVVTRRGKGVEAMERDPGSGPSLPVQSSQ